MPNYNVDVKVVVGTVSDIDVKIKNVINSISDAKTIRAITTMPVGSSRVVAIIVHDA